MKNALAENLQKVSQWKTLWRNFRQGLVNGKCFCGKSAKGSLQKNSLAENPQGLNYNVKLKVKKLKH